MEQHAAHQNVALDVFWIFCEYLFRESIGFSEDFGPALTSSQIVVTKFETRIEIVRILGYSFLEFVEHLRISLESFKCARQTPMGCSEVVVNLNRVTKLEGCFLKL